MRIGDRYKYIEIGVHVDTWEIVNVSRYGFPTLKCVEVVDSKSDWRIGDETDWNIVGDSGWEYIRNKSENFNSLYDKLSA